jgi:hypothetical protein
MKHEAWYLLSCSAETCSFLDYNIKVFYIDCSIVTYCVNIKGTTHIKINMFYLHHSYKRKSLCVLCGNHVKVTPSECSVITRNLCES